MSSRSNEENGRENRPQVDATASEPLRNSEEPSETMRNRIRQELIQELLEACGKNSLKRQIVTELAEMVLQEEVVPHSPSTDDESEDTNNYKWTDVESISEIQDSPYEIGASAEVGEELFEEFKALLEPQQHSTERRRSGTGALRPTKRAIEVLGEERAEIMVTANHHISDSGMVFSSSWIDGEIRGIRIAGLTKVMLVLCLQEQRIARAEKGVMNKLVEKLNLADIIREVLDDLEGIGADQFPKLWNCKETPLPYERSHKYECQKCELFVARTFACMNFLKRDCLENKIVKKMLSCLRIMEDHLDVATDQTRPPKQIQIPTHSETRNNDEKGLETLPSRRSKPTEETRLARGTTSDPVEQLDLQTGKVLASFPSYRAANLALGKEENSNGIRRNVLNAQSSAYGFFWRPVGSKKLPGGVKPIIEKPNHDTPGQQKKSSGRGVEKIDPHTGNVLAAYPTVAAAAKALGLTPNQHSIQDNLSGRLKTAYGFFWRWAGSNDLPYSTSPPKAPVADQWVNQRHHEEIERKGGRPRKAVEQSATQSSDGRLRSSGGSPRHKGGPSTNRENGEPKSGISTDASRSNSNNRTKRSIHEVTGTVEDTSRARKRRFEVSAEELDVKPSEESVPGKISLREISAMSQIKDAPYQVDATAEVGEDLFDSFKALLFPENGSERRQQRPSSAAIKIFGESLAYSVLEASSKIGLSGVVYSPDWKDGMIRGAKVGSIPMPILLLLLQEQRFSRPGVTGALVQVVIDFELCRTVIKALVRWNMVEKYPKVSQTTTHAHFNTQKVQCYKCLIFIARVFHCMKLLNTEAMSESIKQKVESCFQILESNFGPRGSSMPPSSQREPPGVTLPQEVAHASHAKDDASAGSTAAPFLSRSPPKEINENSHILFQVHSSAKAAEVQQVLPTTDVTTVGTMMNGASQDGDMPPLPQQDLSEWVPYDPKEVILSPIETETAWLVEESIYSLRTREIQWRFVWKYASPVLRVELRKIFNSSGNELEQLVRLQDTIVATRFANLRREIRRKLHRAQYRPRMEKAIPDERMASRQLMDSNISNQPAMEISDTKSATTDMQP